MRKTFAALTVAAAALAAPAAADEARLVTIVATPEPQTQLMAMILTMASAQKGAEARVLLCGPGGDVALLHAPDSATAPQKPRDMSPQSVMAALIEEGVPVEVCAIYLPNKGVGAEALLPGVGVASPSAMADALLAEGARLLSF